MKYISDVRVAVEKKLEPLITKLKPYTGAFHEHMPFAVAGAVVLIAPLLYFIAHHPPIHFPVGTVVTIEDGKTLGEVASQFKEEKVVGSALWLNALVIFSGGEDGVMAGDYFFAKPINAWRIAKKILRGEFGLAPARVTLTEGMTAVDMATVFAKKFGRFDVQEFLELAEEKEGYLFPDTYFFLPNVEARDVVRVMEDNFHARIADLREEVETFGRPLNDVVTMASILEKEARRMKTRRTISGILWERLAIGMPLQVDAVFLYINGKNTYELTHDDLSHESLYNTYRYKGLPPGPIANPGLETIRAAVTPLETNYLFYLSDHYGNTYYAETFDEHKLNRALYLNS